MKISDLLSEMHRRRIHRVAALYIVGAWIVLQVADVAFPGMSVPESAIQFIWLGTLLGFPIALFLGWRYDITNGHLTLTASESGQIGDRIGRFDYILLSSIMAVATAITLALAIEISQSRFPDAATTEKIAADPGSIAVLPFANMSGAIENEYFADGLTETLLNSLAQLPDLKVTARTSSFFYKGQEIDVREIAGQLGVSTILEGSVQREGNRVRIVAQLIEAETGFHLWSNSYDRELNDVFAVQDDIANKVSQAMREALGADSIAISAPIDSASTDNLAAYDKYLSGLEQSNTYSTTSLAMAELSFKQALALDPAFHEAKLRLARTYFHQLLNGNLTLDDATGAILPLLDELEEEQRESGLVEMLRSYIAWYHAREGGGTDFDIESARSRIAAAIKLTPNEPELYLAMANFTERAKGREAAISWVDRGLTIDPLDWNLHFERGLLLERDDNDIAAAAAYARATELAPENPSPLAAASRIAWRSGDYAKSFELDRKIMDIDPLSFDVPADIAETLYTVGLLEEGDKYLARSDGLAGEHVCVRLVRAQRALMSEEYAESRRISELMLRENEVSRNNGCLFPGIAVFLSAMSHLKFDDDALKILDELWPEILTSEFEPSTVYEAWVQVHVIFAQAPARSIDENVQVIDKLQSAWYDIAPGWKDSDWIQSRLAIVRGQVDQAVEMTLQLLDSGLSLRGCSSDPQLFSRMYYNQQLIEQEAVANRLVECDIEAAKAGQEIQSYIIEHRLQL